MKKSFHNKKLSSKKITVRNNYKKTSNSQKFFKPERKKSFHNKKLSSKKIKIRNKNAYYERILRVIKNSKPAKELNVDFYKNIEGTYKSYWLGKLINTLQISGNKKTPAKHFYRAFTVLKLRENNNPLLFFLETLDKIKPIFRLRNYIIRRVVIKEYPIPVLRPRRLILAVHWFKEEVRSLANKFNSSLTKRIMIVLKDFKNNSKRNALSKKRDAYIKRSVKGQFNIRYTFR